jgi:hypothetical protein
LALNNAMAKRISELRIEKQTQRIEVDALGKQHVENIFYIAKYNPTIRDFNVRLFAKVVDLVLYGALAVMLYRLIGRGMLDVRELLAAALVVLMIVSPYLESKYGKTLGKKMLIDTSN